MGDDRYYTPNSSGEKKKPISLIAQLMQKTVSMQHVDEAFLWLAKAMVEHTGIDVVQFWALQQDSRGQNHTRIRAAACKNAMVPGQVHTHADVASVIARYFLEQRGTTSVPGKNIFPDAQVSRLAQYNLHYWAGYYLKDKALLPPSREEMASTQVPAPLAIIISFFTPAPLIKEQERVINFIGEQALRIIVNSKLLALRPNSLPQHVLKQPGKNTPLTLSDIIPHRAQNVEELQADNPFASASIIADKNARQLYTAINGNRSIAELASATGFEQKSLFDALYYLLQQQKIQLSTVEGQIIDASRFISSFLKN